MFCDARRPADSAARMAVLLSLVLAAPAHGDNIVWSQGLRLQRQVQGSAPDVMRIPLAAQQFVRIEVMQNGSDLAVILRDPQGQSVSDVDSMNGRYGPETVVVIAESAGEFRLEVKLGNPRDGSNRYELRVVELREAMAADGETVAAHRNYGEGVQVRRHHTPAGRRLAIEKFELALNTFRKSGDLYMTGLTLFSLGTVLAESGEFRKALDTYQEAATQFRAVGDEHAEADALNSEAGALDVLGEPQRALADYQRALSLSKASQDRGLEALLLNNIGWTDSTLGNWQAALEDYRQALDMFRQLGNHSTEALVLNNMGVAYRQLGETDQAVALFEQALPLRRAAGEKRGEAMTLGALANAYLAVNQPKKAVQYLQQALVPWNALGDPRGQADALALLGRAYAELGRFEEAQGSLTKALDLAQNVHDPRTTGIALVNLGRASLLSAQPAKAVEWTEQALSEFRAIGERSYEAVSLETIARAESARGNLAEARRRMEEALRVIEQTRKGTNSEQLRASFFATRQDSYGFYIDLLMRMRGSAPGEPFEALALEANERSRARSLLEMLAESGGDIRQGVDPKLLDREREISTLLNAKGTRLLPLIGRNDAQAAALTQEIRSLELEYQDVEAAIRKSSPRYAAITQPSPLTAAQIRADLLDDDTLLLEYALGEQRSFLWVAGKSGLQAFELPSRVKIEEQARKVYELLTARAVAPRGETAAERQSRIRSADASLVAAARELSGMVIGMAAPALGDKRLLIVPDGALQHVPFGMLPAGDGGEPLLAHHEVVMAPSASALAALRTQVSGRKPAPKMLAVFADPVFDTSDPRAGGGIVRPAAVPATDASRLLEHLAAGSEEAAPGARLHIPRLPFTSQEAEQILKVAPDASNLKAIGFDASREVALSGKLGEYRYIHLATHGYLDTERPALSALVLSQIDRENRPLDGFVRVNDIYNARLSADLAVLSACQTGLGKEVRGEGLMGLTRAFLYAGVPRVVVSLWNVNDSATASLMASFYRRMLRDGKRPAAALREAQLELRKRKQWQSPYYWAAFVEQGEWK